MRNLRFSVPIAIVLSATTINCAHTAAQTPLQAAENQYVQASIVYEAAQKVVVTARANRQVPDSTWRLFDEAQTTVSTEAPIVRAMLESWKATGVKPTGLDAALQLVLGAATTAANIQNGVRP